MVIHQNYRQSFLLNGILLVLLLKAAVRAIKHTRTSLYLPIRVKPRLYHQKHHHTTLNKTALKVLTAPKKHTSKHQNSAVQLVQHKKSENLDTEQRAPGQHCWDTKPQPKDATSSSNDETDNLKHQVSIHTPLLSMESRTIFLTLTNTAHFVLAPCQYEASAPT